MESAIEAFDECLALHPHELEPLVAIVDQAYRELVARTLQQGGLLGEGDFGAAVGKTRPAEPGELHALLRLVRPDPLIDLAPLHVQHAVRQRGIFREPRGVQLLLRFRQLAHRLLGREDSRPRRLVLAAFAGDGAEQCGDESDPAHGREPYIQSIRAISTEAVRPVKSARSPAASACR